MNSINTQTLLFSDRDAEMVGLIYLLPLTAGGRIRQ